jgi:hypothetical protein
LESQSLPGLPATVFRVLLGVFFCFHDLVVQSVEDRGQIVQDVRTSGKRELLDATASGMFNRRNQEITQLSDKLIQLARLLSAMDRKQTPSVICCA